MSVVQFRPRPPSFRRALSARQHPQAQLRRGFSKARPVRAFALFAGGTGRAPGDRAARCSRCGRATSTALNLLGIVCGRSGCRRPPSCCGGPWRRNPRTRPRTTTWRTCSRACLASTGPGVQPGARDPAALRRGPLQPGRHPCRARPRGGGDRRLRPRRRPEARLREGLVQPRHRSRGLGRREAAVMSYDRAVARPDFAEAHYNRGVVLAALGELDAAVAQATSGPVALKPEFVQLNNLGNALLRLCRPADAVAAYDRALAVRPDYVEALVNRGRALLELRQDEVALAAFDRAIALDPGYGDAWWNKSLALLLGSDFAAGGNSTNGAGSSIPSPHCAASIRSRSGMARPRSQAGRSCCTASRPGRRDPGPARSSAGGHLGGHRHPGSPGAAGSSAEVPAGRGGGGGHRRGNSPRGPAVRCPDLEAFGTTLATIPAPARYLAAGPGTRWISSPRGWAGGIVPGSASPGAGARSTPTTGAGASRSRYSQRLLGHPFEFVSLQKDLRPGDERVPGLVRHFGSELEDFSDSAALCRLVDLVVTVDTSAAHLAGALGVATWVLLPFLPDFRWLRDGPDSPWYRR